jgi:hypothetical protein
VTFDELLTNLYEHDCPSDPGWTIYVDGKEYVCVEVLFRGQVTFFFVPIDNPANVHQLYYLGEDPRRISDNMEIQTCVYANAICLENDSSDFEVGDPDPDPLLISVIVPWLADEPLLCEDPDTDFSDIGDEQEEPEP